MTVISTVMTVGSRIILIGIFAMALTGCRATQSMLDCVPTEEAGCMGHPASGEKSISGTTCTSGTACNSPGASCALGGTRHCKNIDTGGGNCVCACTAP